jgi:hypothetical protein
MEKNKMKKVSTGAKIYRSMPLGHQVSHIRSLKITTKLPKNDPCG